jgi:aminopeptidase
VTGAHFRFEEGKVVEWSAADGEETLTELFAIDEQARYLGELALVDAGSPIYTSGLVFHNILFDENAASHIAFGSSYSGGISGGDEMNPEAYRAAGGNVSAVHSDVMIGAPDVRVTGVTRGGASVPIMENGVWML